ncbi:MAG TPA: IMP cyclohydrolase [bacterium]|nr:IMP cyclohydrolase [bacterium]
MKTALISVYNKKGIVKLARYLIKEGYEILATSGTSKYLKSKEIANQEISKYIEKPEILGGRVKTLDYKIFAGILVRKEEEEEEELQIKKIKRISLVVVNLYPFEQIARKENDINKIIENIDIGGVALLRAAAKNFQNTIVLPAPEFYDEFIKKKGEYDFSYRKKLAIETFKITANYDKIIFNKLKKIKEVE